MQCLLLEVNKEQRIKTVLIDRVTLVGGKGKEINFDELKQITGEIIAGLISKNCRYTEEYRITEGERIIFYEKDRIRRAACITGADLLEDYSYN